MLARPHVAVRTAMLLLPGLLIIAAIQLYPSLFTFYLSVQRIEPGTGRYVFRGLDNFARLLNLDNVAVRFTGLRPGEKLAEELFGSDETTRPTDHPRITRTVPSQPAAGFRSALLDLYDAAAHNRADEVREHLRRLVPEYSPPPTSGPVPVPVLASPYPDDY